MKTIELKGRVCQRHEEQTYRTSTPSSKITVELDDYEGTLVLNDGADGRYSDLRVGDNVRVLVLEDAASTLKEPTQLEKVAALVRALEAGSNRTTEEVLKMAESEGWGDKKIEKRQSPLKSEQVICSADSVTPEVK